jgi:drug/metabolite transporter (DMT)-like permease
VSAVLARSLFRGGVPALVVVELRLAIASAILGAGLLLFRREDLRVPRGAWPRLLVLGLLGIAPVQGSYYTTVSLIGVGLAILLQYLAPALVVVYEGVTGRSPWTRQKLVALTLTTGGTALLVLADAGATLRAQPFGVGLGLLSAVFFAFYIVQAKDTVAVIPQWTVNFYGFAAAALFWAVFVPPWKIAAAGYSSTQWILFAAVAVFSVLIPFGLFYRGVERLEAWRAALTAMLEPVVAAVAAWAFLGEGLRPLQWLGAAMLLSGVGWVQWEERNERRSASPARARDHDQRDQ